MQRWRQTWKKNRQVLQITFPVAVAKNGFEVLVARIPKTFELEEVRDNKDIAEVVENNKQQCNDASKKLIVVLNEEKSNLHEGGSAVKDGPNISPILHSDPLWIAPSLDSLFSEGNIVRV